uniref:hypothetical protein n=1 Tax=Streptomyces sp. AC495_CC817 TaxID=2823900 RepID=UPI001C26D7E8
MPFAETKARVVLVVCAVLADGATAATGEAGFVAQSAGTPLNPLADPVAAATGSNPVLAPTSFRRLDRRPRPARTMHQRHSLRLAWSRVPHPAPRFHPV